MAIGGTMQKKLKIIKKDYFYYLMFLIVLAYFIVFSYVPMYGVTLAFKNYRILDGILKSPWAGMRHFNRAFSSPLFWQAFRNTLKISLLRLAVGFPAPIIFALLLNEINARFFKRFLQTASYLPYFISWVALSRIVSVILSPNNGIVNQILKYFGRESIYFITEPSYFVGVLIISGIWQSIGWGSVVYLAAITSVDQEQYESAYLDGANRWHCIRYITIPSILPVISIMLILNLGGILNAGFDQVFNLYSPLVYKVGDIIDTYVYRAGLLNSDFSFGTAVGLFKNVIGFFLVVSTNFLARRFGEGEYGLW